jgi:UDP-2,3-diacylglucosamine hydrolase
MAVYFFSDVHLGEGRPDIDEKKLAKLYSLFKLVAADGEKLFILGDLFDFWFEYKHAVPKAHLQVIFRLAALVESGVEVHYITGNHDFWLGDYLNREAGLAIHRDDLEIREQGRRIYLTHGDGLSPSDGGYRILKRILRNRINIWLYRKIPVDWGIPLARYVAAKSRSHTSGRALKFLQDYEDFARNKLSEGFDAVIIGHLHKPIKREFDPGIYLNTGDFIEHFSYVKLNEGKFNLEFI